MRAVPIILVVLLLAVGGGLWSWREQSEAADQDRVDAARSAVARLRSEIRYRAGTGQTPTNGRGWPTTVDPDWFAGGPPRNPLVGPSHPWLEIAPSWQYGFEDPPQRLALARATASFWYNPGNGVVRARVGQAVSDRRALEIYNRVNGTSLTTLLMPTDAGPSSPGGARAR